MFLIFLFLFSKKETQMWETKCLKNYVSPSSRFEEECTTVEEEDCKTVYDEVWEKKCELVNVTVPTRECRETTETVMENKWVTRQTFSLDSLEKGTGYYSCFGQHLAQIIRKARSLKKRIPNFVFYPYM